MTDAGDFTLDYPVREWVPGHWKEPMLRPIYNIGLPRSGTTSTEAALHQLGYRCKALIVPYVDWQRGRLMQWNLPPDDVPVIMSYRMRDRWLQSVSGYRPHVGVAELLSIYAEHMEWFYSLQRTVGVFSVEQGWEGLTRALQYVSAPFPDPPGGEFPHLNPSPPSAKLGDKSAANG